ncbi:MAG: hypothetical protein WC494_00960 [Candidatus Pacearchaeota archaeon]
MNGITKRGQVSIEYIILVGFITFVIIGTLGLAFFYSGGIKDHVRSNQVSNFAGKIISTAESVYYYGSPSKATISVYLPEGVKEIELYEKNILITLQTSSGIEKVAFTSKVPIEGNLSSSFGIKNIEILAQDNKTTIYQA